MPNQSDQERHTAPSDGSRRVVSGLIQGRLARIKGANPVGLAASSLGLVMGGCLAVGFVAGQWLDQKFGSTYWTPLCLVLGIGAGFRELFHTIANLSAQSEADKRAREAKRVANRTTIDQTERGAGPTGSAVEKKVEGLPAKPRSSSFRVPPPPRSSFDRDRETEVENEPASAQDDDRAKLNEELLKENDRHSSSP